MAALASLLSLISLSWFTVLMDAGIVAGVALAVRLAHRRGVPVSAALDIAWWVLAAALLGARLWYVALHVAEYAANPLPATFIWEGGLALPGAITAGAFGVLAAARYLRLPAGICVDAAAIGTALGQAIGRLGCLPAGCSLGRIVVAGAALPSLPLPDPTGLVQARFPSQLVEALAEAVLGALLLALWRRRLPGGTVGATYLVGYGLVRCLAEPIREPGASLAGAPVALWWAVGALMAGIWLLGQRTDAFPPAATAVSSPTA